MTTNHRISKWIREEDLTSVLLGKGRFFIPDITFREKHDMILVLNQMLNLVKSTREGCEKIRSELMHTLVEITSEEELADVGRCIAIVEGEKDKGYLVDRNKLKKIVSARVASNNDACPKLVGLLKEL